MRKTTGFLGSLGAMTALAAVTGAQDTRTAAAEMSGPALFKSYCSSCHGVDAKGEGPIAHALRFQPSDLTQITRRSEGKFDKEKVHRMIDGREPVKGHGGPDMPLWGDAFRRSGEGFSDEAVKVRIDSLVNYIETLQLR